MAKNLTNILNKSAIANWSGYIYQGLCGLYHALKLINEGVNPSEYKLWLDAYEDFSIEKNNLMVSLHQCKCDTHSPNSYKGEFEKMLQKKEYYADRLSPDCKLWFHCNHDVNIPESCNIQTYTYHNGQFCCPPTEIIDLIKAMVEDILRNQKLNSDIHLITSSLIACIDRTVLKVHKDYLNGSKNLCDSAQEESHITFREIVNILQTEIINFDADCVYRLWKITFLTNMKDIIDSISVTDTEKIDIMVNSIESMTDSELKDFFQRVNPDINILKNSTSFVNITNIDRAGSLLNVVKELKKLDSNTLSWNEKDKYETPTAIKFDKNMIRWYCSKIINNSVNLNSIWIYDWMVGYGEFNKVDNIYEQTPSIVSTPDPTSIFRHKKVGIITIKDMQDGNYN